MRVGSDIPLSEDPNVRCKDSVVRVIQSRPGGTVEAILCLRGGFGGSLEERLIGEWCGRTILMDFWARKFQQKGRKAGGYQAGALLPPASGNRPGEDEVRCYEIM